MESRATKRQKHTTGGIPRWSPTLVLIARFSAYVWQSGRDAQFSLTYGRMYLWSQNRQYENLSMPVGEEEVHSTMRARSGPIEHKNECSD
jgi:hypothetical protein